MFEYLKFVRSFTYFFSKNLPANVNNIGNSVHWAYFCLKYTKVFHHQLDGSCSLKNCLLLS